MAGTYYKYAERDADSQINWAEVGREASGMLLEVNRVREEKKDALDKSQREAMSFVANSPNGEHKGSRESILDLADQASNRLRIADKLLKSGQMSPKDVIVFRQNVTDNVNLAFNANKAYQESYKEIMDRARAGDSSGLELNNAEEVEGFGNWKNIGWEISPNGIIMAGKITEEDVDGKKVRTLSKNQGSLRSMDYLNQTIIGRIDKYDYQTPVKNFVDSLGEEKKTVVLLGKIQQQGKVTSVEDITSRKDLDPNTQQELFSFIQAENDKIKEIAGTNLDSARILFDDAIIAPNNKPYRISTNPKEKGEDVILKTVDTDTGGFKYELTAAQKKDAEEFIRTQMRSQYDYKEEGQVVGAVSRDEPSEDALSRKAAQKEKDNALGTWGDVFKAGTPEAKKAAIETIVGSKLSQQRGLLDIDTSVSGKVTFKYADPVKNRTLDYDPNNITLRQWNEIGNEVHGIDNVAETMKRNKGGDPNMKMNTSQRNFQGVRAGRTPVKNPEVEFSNKVSSVPVSAYKLRDYNAAPKFTELLKGTGLTVEPASLLNPSNKVFIKYGDQEYGIPVNNDDADAVQEKSNFEAWVEKVVPAEAKQVLLEKGVIGGGNTTGTVQGGVTR